MSIGTHQQGALCYLASDRLSVPHCFSTRLGGVSTGSLSSLNLGGSRGDDGENVRENFQRLGEAVGFDARALAGTHQVHGKVVRQLTRDDLGSLWRPTDWACDGLITDVPGLPLAVFSADCCPVLLYDPVRRAVGAVHAGWKGTALGIAGEAVRALESAYGCRPRDLLAAIGPCIGQGCFETGPEVPAAMTQGLGDAAQRFISRSGDKFHVDLKGINRTWLEQAGVLPEHIDVSDACTACWPDLYWSYRRHGDGRGSLASVIVLPEAAR